MTEDKNKQQQTESLAGTYGIPVPEARAMNALLTLNEEGESRMKMGIKNPEVLESDLSIDRSKTK